MKLAVDILEERISAAMTAATGRKDCAAIVRPSTDPRFGDYQANGVMALAKKLHLTQESLPKKSLKGSMSMIFANSRKWQARDL